MGEDFIFEHSKMSFMPSIVENIFPHVLESFSCSILFRQCCVLLIVNYDVSRVIHAHGLYVYM